MIMPLEATTGKKHHQRKKRHQHHRPPSLFRKLLAVILSPLILLFLWRNFGAFLFVAEHHHHYYRDQRITIRANDNDARIESLPLQPRHPQANGTTTINKSPLTHDDGVARETSGALLSFRPISADAASTTTTTTKSYRYHSSSNFLVLVDPPSDLATLRLQLRNINETAFRFPSVKERVRYYMGDGWWYDDRRPFNATAACLTSQRYGRDTWEPNLLYQTILVEQGLLPRPKTRWYMADVYDYLVSKMPTTTNTGPSDGEVLPQLPGMILVHFGDLRDEDFGDMPVFVKSRLATEQRTMTGPAPTTAGTRRGDRLTTTTGTGSIRPRDPILAPLNVHRHFYEPIQKLTGKTNNKKRPPDRPWKEKNSTLVWRGGATGLQHGKSSPGEDLARLRLLENVFENFVLGSNNHDGTTSSLLDIGFTELIQVQREHQAKYQYLVKESLSFREQLDHKYLLNLEGNDVSSGLKWMLLSNSVVFMPIPTCVSWAMEEFLRPWFHYVPLRDDLSDLVDKILWCRAPDDECHQISQHATAYMQALWMSPQAKADQKAILTEMMRRYQAFYGIELARACRRRDDVHRT